MYNAVFKYKPYIWTVTGHTTSYNSIHRSLDQPDENGRAPLGCAAESGRLGVVKTLLEQAR